MVSTLAAQLQQLREGGAGSKRKTDTFLYDSREAAQLDDETVYNLAWNGLLELKQMDAAFEAFDPSRDPARLFSRQRIHFHRVQLNKAEDEALNVALAKLLDTLSGYFLLGATHKVVEFLVRRYEIHRFNVDDVMAMVISYHESSWFAKMVKILHIHHTKWEFLLPIKQQQTNVAEPLLRSALVQRSIDDSSVISFIFASATRIGASHPKLISLYALIVLEMMERTAVNEPMLRWLIPDVLIALKTQQFPEMQAAAYMIITKLASKAVLSKKVVDTLAKHLVKYAQQQMGGGGAQMNALLCVIHIAETQPSFSLSSSHVGKYLVTMTNLVDCLSEVAGNYESVAFVRHLVIYLLDHMKQVDDDDHHALLVDVVSRVTAFEYIAGEVVTQLVTLAGELGYDASTNDRVAAISSVLIAISKKYVTQADESVQSILSTSIEVKTTSSTKKRKHKKQSTTPQLSAFLERTFGQIANSAHFVPAHADATTSLALALDHPTETTRFRALQTLEEQHTAISTDNSSAERALSSPGVLLRRLQDDSARIVTFVATSSLGDLLLELASKKKVFDTIVLVIQQWASRGDKVTAVATVESLMQLLIGRFRAVYSSDWDAKILLLALSLLPRRISSAKSPSITVKQVSEWVSALDHPFAVAISGAAGKVATLESLAQHLGIALANTQFTPLLPFCLSWTQVSDVNVKPLTSLLIPVLRYAREQLHQKISKLKSAKSSSTTVFKDYSKSLDQALRFVLKKEFVRMCEMSESERSAESSMSVLDIAQLLGKVAADTFAFKLDEFDACVVTLLQAPASVFEQIQDVFVQIFQQSSSSEHDVPSQDDLLPTLGRILVQNSTTDEDGDLLSVLAKIRALDIVSVVMEGNNDGQDVECALPIVIVALGDYDKKVREAALGCIQRWASSMADEVSNVQMLVNVANFLVDARGDILMDSRAVSTLCGTYEQSNLTDPSFAGWIAGLMAGLTSETQLPLVYKLAELLKDVPSASVWIKTTQLAKNLLASLSSDASLTVSSNKKRVLKSLFEHYLAGGNGASSQDQAVTKAFHGVLIEALQDDDKDRLPLLADVQAFVLSRLSHSYFAHLDEVSQHVLVIKLLHLLMVAEESVASQLIRCVSGLPLTSAMFVRLVRDEIAAKSDAPTKSRRRAHATGNAKDSEYFQDLSCILEVLAIKVDDVAGEDVSGSSDSLLQALTDVLDLVCRPENTDRASEYLLQIVFGCLRRVCEVHATTAGNTDVVGIAVHSGKQPSKASRSSSQAVLEPEHLVKHTLVCLGRTTSPQTRNEALLFVSSLVNVYPTSVLRSLDKILSFVSNGAIHHDDAYSFSVLETITKAVVPHILTQAADHSSNTTENDRIITCQEFIRIFVDAYGQIPVSRRDALFQVLVQSLGRAYLPYVVIAIIQNGVLLSANVTSAELEDRVKFAHQLCFSFDGVTQISGLVMQLRLVRDLYSHVVDDGETDTDDVDEDEDEEDARVKAESNRFHWDTRVMASQELARKLNLAVVSFIPAHLQARDLHHEILRIEEESELMNDNDEDEEEPATPVEQLQQHYLVLAQVVLLYFRRLAHEQAVHEDSGLGSDAEDLARGFWGALSQQTIEILGSLQQLLSTPGFVAVISELLHHENSLVRKKAMQLFNERLQDDRSSLTPGEELLFVDMVEELDSILLNADSSENSVNIQTALLSVDILARNFAAQHTKRFQAILPTIVNYVNVDVTQAKSTNSTKLHLMGCAFVSLSSICRAVGPLVFPYLPKFFPSLLSAITYCSSSSSPSSNSVVNHKSQGNSIEIAASSVSGVKTVLQCLLAALEVFTDHIPQFLTPYLSNIVNVLLSASLVSKHAVSVKSTSASVTQHQLALSVDSCFTNLTNHIELRHLLPNLFGSYEVALSHGDVSIEKLFSVVSTVVGELKGSDLRQYLPQFARFFVTSLDLRRVHTERLQDLDAVEDEVLEVLVQFILRLSEKQLKPLFLKIAEWAQHLKTPRGETARHIVFFKLLLKLSERLKSIFVPYYAHVLEMLTKALRSSREALLARKTAHADESESDGDDDDFFAKDDADTPANGRSQRKKRKLLNGSADADLVSREMSLLQLQMAVRALNGCFVHDNDGIIDKEKFDVVMAPLVETMDILKTVPDERTFIFDTLSETLANLAWAAKNDLLWKPMHYAVLMKSRGDCPAVRVATLKVVEKCYQVIGDEFLAMLPESIPFLAELMEDNDAEVERTCHHVIKQIEDISGESLDQYLTI